MVAKVKETARPYIDLDDQQLLAVCQSSDKQGWQEFITRYTNLIYYVIKYRCGFREEDADEIYQSVFVKILRNIGRVRDNTKLRSWLLAVTWNECIDYSRKRNVLQRFFVPEEAQDSEVCYEQEYYLSLREMLGMFQRAFRRLSPQNKELLNEKYNGSTVDEISDKMNIPKGSIYYNHKKACKELSEILKDMNYNYEDFQEAFSHFLLPVE